MGKCECMYAALPDGNGCTLCRIPCGPLAECDEKGNAYLLMMLVKTNEVALSVW